MRSSVHQLELIDDIGARGVQPEILQASASKRTPRVRYIGSKARIADQLVRLIGDRTERGRRFVDLFCGSGSVSRAAFAAGWPVHVNDHLYASTVVAYAQVVSGRQLNFDNLGGYDAAIQTLNASAPKQGVLYKEYAPSGLSRSGHSRMYFTEENAEKIDGVRAKIEAWHLTGKIQDNEKTVLLADLISAANSVANIAGTFGCFLSRWTPAALQPLRLYARHLVERSHASTYSIADAFDFCDDEEDILYCDPPYTKRQYAAYYHLVETIALGDFPEVGGVAGIRPWEHNASPFCYKRRALNAFERVVLSKRAKKIFFSYSSDAHVALDDLAGTLSKFGRVRIEDVKAIPRYAPNLVSRTNARPVTEYLIELVR